MQLSAQKNTKAIALTAVSLSILVVVGAVVGAIFFRGHRAEAEPGPETAPFESPQSTPSATPQPSPSVEPSPQPEAMPPVRQEQTAAPLQQQPPAPMQLAPVLPVATVKPGSAANMRQAPSIQANVLQVLMPGETVQIDRERSIFQNGVTWYPVIVGEAKGWIASSLLTDPEIPAQARQYQPDPVTVPSSFVQPTFSRI